MAASAECRYQWSDTEAIEVEVCSDTDYPDMLDDLTARAANLLEQAIAKVNAQAQR